MYERIDLNSLAGTSIANKTLTQFVTKMTSPDEPKGDPTKSLRFLETFDDRPLPDIIQAETHHELNETFYNSMVGYVIDHKEQLLSTSEITEIEDKLETQNVDRMTYVSGNVFEGLSSESIPHKTGRLCLDGGAIYEGQLNDGIPEGRGIIRWLDGSWYSGEFLKGLRHGRGLHVSCEDGRRWYSGDWTNGTRNGRGETACCVGQPDGALNYSGDWVDGRPHGSGTASWPDETRYTGGWARGRQHGHGKVVWPSNDVYEGDWIDGHMDGTGTYEWNTNPRDYDRLVLLCLCDKYTGQWSKSKKHGLGVFYSADTGTTVTGRWVDDSLDGPCEIVLSTGRPPKASGLVFRNNVLYEPRPETPSPANTGHRLAVSTPGRKRRLSYKPVTTAAVDCPLLAAYGNRVQGSRDFRSTASARLVRADIQLVNSAEGETSCDYDLTDHVLRIADKCREDLDEVTTPVGGDLETDLRDAECALSKYDERLAGLYRAYGAFLADGPIPYRPLMTRLGLWQMIVDSRLHEHVSLADFDDLLYKNKKYAFASAHDPFEPIYFWQFVHAVCALATVAHDDTRWTSHKANRTAGGNGLMALALSELFEEHVKIDIVPTSYDALGNDPLAAGRWANSRQTFTAMYDMYRNMTTTDAADSPATTITVHQMIRLCGGNDGVLPALLDVVFVLADEVANAAAMFEFSTSAVATLLSEACPTAVDLRDDLPRPLLVALNARLTFADWYRFVLMCVRECRVPLAEKHDRVSFTIETTVLKQSD